MWSNEDRRLEAWLMLAAMIGAMVWYARPQLGYLLNMVRLLTDYLAARGGG